MSFFRKVDVLVNQGINNIKTTGMSFFRIKKGDRNSYESPQIKRKCILGWSY